MSSKRGSPAVVVGPDEPPVTEDRDPVGDGVDLVEEVRDEHDRDARATQLAHDPEQLVGLVGVEARGRLVEDQDPRRRDLERPGDGRHLLDRNRVGPERLADVDVDVEPAHDLVRPGGGGPWSRSVPSAGVPDR